LSLLWIDVFLLSVYSFFVGTQANFFCFPSRPNDATAQATALFTIKVSAAPYFRALGVKFFGSAFIGDVLLDFGIADATGRCHVPLRVSPWVHSTCRGS